MAVEIPTYIPPKEKKEKPPKKVGVREAKKILRKLIDEVKRKPEKDWHAGASLLWIDSNAMGKLGHGYIMEKEKLQATALEVMKSYGLDENNFRGGISQDSDPIDFKIVRGYFTEYRDYPTRFKDLFFRRVVRTEGGRKCASWDVRKSSVYYRESMPRVT